MARFRRMEVLERVLGSGLIPIFYNRSPETSVEVARAVARGGSTIIEFTHRGDFAHHVFEALIQTCRREVPELMVGAGTIGDPHTAAMYLAMGADFVVAPGFNPDVARLCNRRKVAYIPGCATPAEIAAAEEIGCELVKIFPADALGGPAFIKAVLAPSPWSSLVITGGVDTTQENISEWFGAGAAALGIGSRLITKEVLARGDFDALAERTSQVLEWIRAARESH